MEYERQGRGIENGSENNVKILIPVPRRTHIKDYGATLIANYASAQLMSM